MCYMRADYSVINCVADQEGGDCRKTAEYMELQLLAIFIIVFYAVLLPALFFAILVRERRAIVDGRETKLTRAVELLYRAYKPQFWCVRAWAPCVVGHGHRRRRCRHDHHRNILLLLLLLRLLLSQPLPAFLPCDWQVL